ncbi:hypothetical protein MNV49_000010 [Pseudohyphozyma bogoriensis]|nr:hypothetical protein MNV49_000010 [Pseudohyphozyma bogoriensis]
MDSSGLGLDAVHQAAETAGPSRTTPVPVVPSPARLPHTKFIPQSPKSPKFRPTPPVLAFLHTSEAREAVLRLTQYTLRLSLYFRHRVVPRKYLAVLFSLVSLLSALRRILSLVELSTSAVHILRSLNPFVHLRGEPSDKGKGKAVRTAVEEAGLYYISREGLGLVATIADNLYLFAKLGILPVSPKRSRQFDKTADCATLLSAAIGLVQVARSRDQVWREGRGVRKGVVRMEEELEIGEFWKTNDDDERGKKLRDKLRMERRKLRGLRDELNDLWWERLRLTCEAVFSTYDALDLETASEAVRSWMGIVSAGIM